MSGGGQTDQAIKKAETILKHAQTIDTLSQSIKQHMIKAMAQNRMDWLTDLRDSFTNTGSRLLEDSKNASQAMSKKIEEEVRNLKAASKGE